MGKAVRVSVAVVEGEGGPIALVPSQEEVVCPEAVFLNAGLASEREAARREVLAHILYHDLLTDPALQDRHHRRPLLEKGVHSTVFWAAKFVRPLLLLGSTLLAGKPQRG